VQGRKRPDEASGSSRSASRSSSHTYSDSRDLIDLKLALADRGVELVSYVVGKTPDRTSRRTVRLGSKGAFAYEASGPKRGQWFDHEASEGGDLLDLIKMRVIGRDDFVEALRWARSWLGWPVDGPAPVDSKRDERRRAQAESLARAEAEAAADRRERIARAERIWKRSQPIAGTVAERYIRETRRIPVETWPETVRFDPVENALVVMGTDDDGALCGVQLVRLTAAATKIPDGGPKLVKQSYGAFDGAAVHLPGSEHGPVILAEGPETGLSVWAATGYETRIALGSMSKLSPPAGRRAVLALDDDKADAPSRRALRTAQREWRETGRDVVEAHPWETRRGDKSDFNDVIRQAGPVAVRARINLVVDKPHIIGQRLIRLDEARATLDRRVAEWAAAAQAWPPEAGENYPVHAIGVTLGTGKTETAIRHAETMLRSMRGAGDERVIVIAVPEHRLSAEVANRAEALGIKVAIWRGREAHLPGDDEAKMCGNVEEVRLAQRMFADIDDDVCKTCPLRDGCAYLAQREQDADLWIVGHPLIFHATPNAIRRRGVAALIVDESPWQAGLIGIDGGGIEVALDVLDPSVLPLPRGDGPDGGARLEDLRQRLKIAVENEGDGPVRREALKAVGFDANSGAVASGLEWRRKVETGPWREREDNRTLGQMNALWSGVHALMQPDGPEVSGWLTLGRSSKPGPKVRVIKVTGRRDIGASWRVPTLLIDASLDEALVRPYWPQVQVTARIEVETPHMRVRQAAGRAYSKAMLAPLSHAAETVRAEKVEERRRKARERLRAFVTKVDRERGGRTLVVSNKAIIEALGLPQHIERAHFNAVAGRDIWGNVASVIVVGRPQPSPKDAERIAGALTGKAPQSIGDKWYPRGDVHRRQKVDGGVRIIPGQADAHPDETVERIRQRIAEGEVMQAIGRGRGVNRTAADELEVLVLSDAVLPVPVDDFLPDEVTKPEPADLMLAEDGIAYQDAVAAAAAHPSLWASAEAARKALQRQRCGTFWYKGLSIPNCPALPRAVTVAYRRAGQGQRQAQATVDLRIHPDPRAALEQSLGPLAFFDIIERQADAEPIEAVVLDFPAPQQPIEETPQQYARTSEEPVVVDLDAVRMAVRDGGVRYGVLAGELSMSTSQLSNILAGRRRLKPDDAERLAQIIATIQPVQGRLL